MFGAATSFVALPAYLRFAAGELPPTGMFRQLAHVMGIDEAFGAATSDVSGSDMNGGE
jgi:hypothetical protein